jgi:hypothetical protein
MLLTLAAEQGAGCALERSTQMAEAERGLDGLHIALLTASASRLGGGVASAVQGRPR